MSGSIQEGFPKLAIFSLDIYFKLNRQYNRYGDMPRCRFYFPAGTAFYNSVLYDMKPKELVLLISSRAGNWTNSEECNRYYFAPVSLLKENKIPINSITRWKKNFTRFPKLQKEIFTVINDNWFIDNGFNPTTPK